MDRETAERLAGDLMYDPWVEAARHKRREDIANPPEGYSYRFREGPRTKGYWCLIKN